MRGRGRGVAPPSCAFRSGEPGACRLHTAARRHSATTAAAAEPQPRARVMAACCAAGREGTQEVVAGH